MNLRLAFAACAASLLLIAGCSGMRDNASRGSSSAGSSGAYPTGSTSTPSGASAGQGAGTSGSATNDTGMTQDSRQRKPGSPQY